MHKQMDDIRKQMDDTRRRQMGYAWSKSRYAPKQVQIVRPVRSDPRVSHVEQEAARLRQQAVAGRLDQVQLRQRLEDLMFQDDSGTWWMLGTETGRWYRDDGHGWVAARPPLGHGSERPTTSQQQPTSSGQGGAGGSHPLAHAVGVVLMILLGAAIAVLVFFGVGGGSYELLQALGVDDPSGVSLVLACLAGGACLLFTWRAIRR